MMWYFFPLVRQVCCDWRNPCNLLIFKKKITFSIGHNLIEVSLTDGIHVALGLMIGWSYSFQSDFLGTDKKTNKKFKSISGDVNSCSDMILTVSQKWMVHKQTFWRTFIIIRQEFHTKNIKYPNVRILKRLNKIVQNYANRCYRNNLIFFFLWNLITEERICRI